MNIKFMTTLMLSMIFTLSGQAKSHYTEASIMGVWKLTKFVVADNTGLEQQWCKGAYGSIAYLSGQMSVSINCEEVKPGSGAEQIGGYLFYSGPFEVDQSTGEVVHRVRNYSHPNLNKVYRRLIDMSDENNLRLVGFLEEGKTAIVEWTRLEKFSYNSNALIGVWELIGSENEVADSDQTIPFCTGFSGTILYTSGGYAAVSINCSIKEDPKTTEPADQFGRKFFYAGSYEQQGKILIQTPDNASQASLIGVPAKRLMNISGDFLTLEGINGSKFKAIWRKMN